MKSNNDWNKSSPKAKKLIKKAEQAIRSIVPEAEIILYGSHARGDAGALSDWDFLILVRQPVDRNLTIEIRNKLYDVELETDTVLSCIVRTRKEWESPRYSVLPFKRVVEREGILV
jgi:predicted nucleotidyltransferase